MVYRLPEISDKAILQDYVQEHYNHNETEIDSSMGLSFSDYPGWVAAMLNNALTGDPSWGKCLISLCFDQDKLIGLLNIRYDL
ncbi:MAG: hypothetical protein IJ486_00390 [Firmicutes bacterium]|nr:hypothetical protein [Bacillota bacterium]